MKVKVIKEFIDKKTGKLHTPKKDAVLDLSEQRIKEINSKGKFIEVLKEEAATAVVKDNDTKKENR